jgi:hypothetical protein
MDVETMLTTIRGAFVDDATDEARRAGNAACRAMLAVLEPAPQQPQIDTAMIARAVAGLRGAHPDQLLELAIAKLRGALPAGTQLTPSRGFKMPLLPKIG